MVSKKYNVHKGTYFKEVHGKVFMLRENTLDEYVAKETCYRLVTYTPDDVWIDIGGNIGSFPVHIADRVKTIHTYEPDQTNLRLLERNLQLNNITNCVIHPLAVVWDDRDTTDFYLNNKKNKGAHGMFATRGRTKISVPCININQVLAEVHPTKIKIDAEGAEYELIKAIKSWDGIAELIFEYHTLVLRDFTGVKLAELYKLLTPYFDVSGKSPDALARNWFTIVHCIRK